MFKRAKISVTRRKTKTVIFFLFLFIVANLVLSSISIKNATEESMNIARRSLGSEVILSTDMEKLREEFMNNSPAPSEGDIQSEDMQGRKQQMQGMHEVMNQSNATINDVNTLKEISYVSDVKYYFTVNGEEESFTLYEESTSESENGFMGKGKMMNNSLQIEAINTFKLEDKYVGGQIELVEGEAFEEDDEDAVIISYELATSNDLSIDSEITIKDSDGESHTLKVIGIYQSKEEGFNNNYNLIYINTKTGEKFLTEEEYNNGNYNITKAVFYLNDPENADKFKEEANKLVSDLSDRYLTLDIDNQTYEQMISSIEGVAKFSNTILVIVIIASIVVISLMVINSLKDRNYEIGVLLSLGEKKKKIIGQFIIELVIISSVAFVLSIGTSLFTSQKFADILIDNQSKSTEVSNQSPMGGRGSSYNQNGNFEERKDKGIGSLTGISSVDTIDEIDVSVTPKDVGLLFIIGYAIIFVSMIIPSIRILNSDPKDILSRRE